MPPGAGCPGIVDTAADITIMEGKLFQEVASVAKLKKKNFKPPGIIPCTNDQKSFSLDECTGLDVEFQEKKMKTTIYIKMSVMTSCSSQRVSVFSLV